MSVRRATGSGAARAGHRGPAAILGAVEALAGAACSACAAPLCAHEALMCVWMGVERRPRCARCMADALGIAPEAFAGQVREQVLRFPCYRAAWDCTGTREPAGCVLRPA